MCILQVDFPSTRAIWSRFITMNMSSSATLAAILTLGLVLGVGGCDVVSSEFRPFNPGDRLTVTEYTSAQPASREAYAEMGVIGGTGAFGSTTSGRGRTTRPASSARSGSPT